MAVAKKRKRYGPLRANEIATRHGMSEEQMRSLMAQVGIEELAVPNEFGLLTASEAERVLAEVYRRKGARVLPKRIPNPQVGTDG